jgi:Icc-related predicted phosphoesterase
MRYLVVADIHSNLEALQAVIAHAKSQGGFDGIWCLGDIVGYGADPNACLTSFVHTPLQLRQATMTWRLSMPFR